MSEALWQQAQRLHDSRLFKTASPEHAYAICCVGAELGIGATTALANISVIQGKPSLGASLVGALIQKSGTYGYTVTEMTDQKVSIEFFEQLPNSNGQGVRHLGTSTFTLEDARTAGLGGSQTWKSYPRNLLLARALTNGARWFTPSVFAGAVYDPSEVSEVEASSPEAPPAPAPAAMNGANGGATLEQLLDRYGAEAIVAATGGGIPATAEEVAAVAERLAAGAAQEAAAPTAEEET